MRQYSSHMTKIVVVPSYAAYLAMEPSTREHREQLIAEIVWDCYARYHPGLRALLRRRMHLSHEDAEDILQSILFRWTQQLQARRKLPAPEALSSWFRSVARNAAISHLRRARGKRRQAEIDFANRRLAKEQRSPLSDLLSIELPAVIATILRENASAEMHRVFELWLRGLTYAEIADRLSGKTAEAVRSLLRKVLVILRKELTRLGWSVH